MTKNGQNGKKISIFLQEVLIITVTLRRQGERSEPPLLVILYISDRVYRYYMNHLCFKGNI